MLYWELETGGDRFPNKATASETHLSPPRAKTLEKLRLLYASGWLGAQGDRQRMLVWFYQFLQRNSSSSRAARAGSSAAEAHGDTKLEQRDKIPKNRDASCKMLALTVSPVSSAPTNPQSSSASCLQPSSRSPGCPRWAPPLRQGARTQSCAVTAVARWSLNRPTGEDRVVFTVSGIYTEKSVSGEQHVHRLYPRTPLQRRCSEACCSPNNCFLFSNTMLSS